MLLVTTDSVIDGVHLRWDEQGPEAFGYKAVARGLSDIAAMGGEPLWALLAVCLPQGVSDEEAQAVYLGAESTGCELVGGDTTLGPTPYVAATVLGRAHPKGPARRSGARIEDGIYVTGPLGRSLESGRHFRFRPRIEMAKRLMDSVDVGAMIDISDGLGCDLHHILEASGVGCRVEASAVPLNPDATIENALGDGEDYELLFTAAGEVEVPGAIRIGVIAAGPALLAFPDGREAPLPDSGYEHGD
jgi:thiamine-monophosphate kinase